MQDYYFGLSGLTPAELVFYGALTVSAAVMLIHYLKSEKPLKTAFKGMASGGMGLVLLHFFGGKIGLALPLNFFTAFVSLVLGLPGTVLLAVAELIKS